MSFSCEVRVLLKCCFRAQQPKWWKYCTHCTTEYRGIFFRRSLKKISQHAKKWRRKTNFLFYLSFFFFLQESANSKVDPYRTMVIGRGSSARHGKWWQTAYQTKRIKTVQCSGWKQGRLASTSMRWYSVELWSCAVAADTGRHQQKVRSNFHRQTALGNNCMCWFCTVTGFGSSGENSSWFEVSWGTAPTSLTVRWRLGASGVGKILQKRTCVFASFGRLFTQFWQPLASSNAATNVYLRWDVIIKI